MIQTMNKLVVLLSLALLPALSIADTPKGFHELKIGDSAPAFELIGIDEEKHTLADYAKADLLMVAFISNHCPTSQAIESRLKKLVADHKGKLQVVAINPNDPGALRADELGYSAYNDSFPEMKKHAAGAEVHLPLPL
jgi:thiol-disulfide isomerase/thioredoxin